MYMQNKCIFWSAVHMVATQAGFASTYSKCEIMFLSEHAQYTYSTRKVCHHTTHLNVRVLQTFYIKDNTRSQCVRFMRRCFFRMHGLRIFK